LATSTDKTSCSAFGPGIQTLQRLLQSTQTIEIIHILNAARDYDAILFRDED
jgi:ABC-type multidrug transport system fused ATPase/permease subunit